MGILKNKNDAELTLTLSGRLDTTTAPQLEAVVNEETADVTSLIFDFENLDYVSSAGLRVLLSAQKLMNKQGKMVIRQVKPEIMEVFDITGFSGILTIE